VTRPGAAFHEAGHGCVAGRFGVPISFVSIEPQPDSLGVMTTAVPFSELDTDHVVLFSLAEQRHLVCDQTQLGDAGDVAIVRLLVAADCMLDDIAHGRRVRRVPRHSDRVTAGVDLWRPRRRASRTSTGHGSRASRQRSNSGAGCHRRRSKN
jgi:hypothetical protein